jgi:hypothetical protein
MNAAVTTQRQISNHRDYTLVTMLWFCASLLSSSRTDAVGHHCVRCSLLVLQFGERVTCQMSPQVTTHRVMSHRPPPPVPCAGSPKTPRGGLLHEASGACAATVASQQALNCVRRSACSAAGIRITMCHSLTLHQRSARIEDDDSFSLVLVQWPIDPTPLRHHLMTAHSLKNTSSNTIPIQKYPRSIISLIHSSEQFARD